MRALRSIADEMARTDAWEAVVVDNASIGWQRGGRGRFAPHGRGCRNEHRTSGSRAASIRGGGVQCAARAHHESRLPARGRRRRARCTTCSTRTRDCAIVGPRILNPDGSVQGSARGDPDMLTGSSDARALLRRLLPSLPSPAQRRRGRGHPQRAPERRWSTGCRARACWRGARRSTRSAGSTNGSSCTGKTPISAAGCGRVAITSATCPARPPCIASASRAAPRARLAIRAFHESAYLYYATHVAPARFNPKRALARAILHARCWLQVVASGAPLAPPERRNATRSESLTAESRRPAAATCSPIGEARGEPWRFDPGRLNQARALLVSARS